ncbi:hypothetical protein ACTXT7_009799 [Hymenolepis weldensis]
MCVLDSLKVYTHKVLSAAFKIQGVILQPDRWEFCLDCLDIRSIVHQQIDKTVQLCGLELCLLAAHRDHNSDYK